jgi:hypothetical protein
MTENPAKKSTSQSPRLRQALEEAGFTILRVFLIATKHGPCSRIQLRGPLGGEEYHAACQVIEATLGPQAHYALNLREKEGCTESIRRRAQEVRAGKE